MTRDTRAQAWPFAPVWKDVPARTSRCGHLWITGDPVEYEKNSDEVFGVVLQWLANQPVNQRTPSVFPFDPSAGSSRASLFRTITT